MSYLTVTRVDVDVIDTSTSFGEPSVAYGRQTVRLTGGGVTVDVDDWITAFGGDRVPNVMDRYSIGITRLPDPPGTP